MSHYKFIESGLARPQYKTRRVGNIVRDENNVFYSYGGHYPLVWKCKGRYFVNDSGYSISTSKHIGHAFSAVRNVTGERALPVALDYSKLNHPWGWYRNTARLDDLEGATLEALRVERKEQLKEIKTLSKRSFRKRANAIHRLLVVEDSMSEIKLRFKPFFTAEEKRLWQAVTCPYKLFDWDSKEEKKLHKLRYVPYQGKRYNYEKHCYEPATCYKRKRLDKFTLEEIVKIAHIAGIKFKNDEALRIWKLF